VDSFSNQPGVEQPERENRTSESAKPADGLSRRHMLAGLAILPVTLPAAAAVAADPAFALIAEKRAADIAHCKAIDAQDEAETRYGHGSLEAWDANEKCGDACEAVHEIDWKLANTAPTTLAGVAAVLRLANDIEDEGNEWPMTDTIGAEGWHYQLRASMAQALEAIIHRGEG
jgi:hypothetical protein